LEGRPVITHGTPESVCSVTNLDISSIVSVYEIVGGAQNVSPAERIESMSMSVAMLLWPIIDHRTAGSQTPNSFNYIT
jgi:hypothetical protein